MIIILTIAIVMALAGLILLRLEGQKQLIGKILLLCAGCLIAIMAVVGSYVYFNIYVLGNY